MQDDKLILIYCHWIPSEYEKPAGVELKEDGYGQESLDRLPLSDLFCVFALKQDDGPTIVTQEKAVSKPETEAELGTFQKAPLSRSNSQSLQPVAIVEDYMEVLTPCTFIENPISRVIASVKILYGDYGVFVEEFISWYIAEQGISKIIEQVFEVIDVEFMQWLALPQAKRAEAAESTLQPLDVKSNRKAVYMSLLKVPERARFWANFRHAFPEGVVDESRDHMMMCFHL